MEVFAFPFRFANGRPVTIPADSHQAVEQQVEAVLRTTRGERLELPDYGVPDQTFITGGPSAQPVREAIEAWAPRARAIVTEDDSDLADMIGRIAVQLKRGNDETGGR